MPSESLRVRLHGQASRGARVVERQALLRLAQTGAVRRRGHWRVFEEPTRKPSLSASRRAGPGPIQNTGSGRA